MKNLTRIACALALTTMASTVAANPLIIDAGDNEKLTISFPGPVVGTTTLAQGAEFTEFGFQISGATSQYYDIDGNGISAGDMFVDQGSFDSLTLNSVTNDTGFGSTWSLSADYSLYGPVVSDGVELLGGIAGGFLNIFYEDLTDDAGCTLTTCGTSFVSAEATTTQVLSIAVTGSSGPINTSVGVNVSGIADYSFLGSPDTFVEEFFNLLNPMTVGGVTSNNLFELYEAGFGATPSEFVDILSVTTLNGNAGATLTAIEDLVFSDPALVAVPVSGLTSLQTPLYAGFLAQMATDTGIAGYGTGTYKTIGRTGEVLSGNISVVDVPEPSTIAILGLTLLGFGATARRKNSK